MPLFTRKKSSANVSTSHHNNSAGHAPPPMPTASARTSTTSMTTAPTNSTYSNGYATTPLMKLELGPDVSTPLYQRFARAKEADDNGAGRFSLGMFDGSSMGVQGRGAAARLYDQQQQQPEMFREFPPPPPPGAMPERTNTPPSAFRGASASPVPPSPSRLGRRSTDMGSRSESASAAAAFPPAAAAFPPPDDAFFSQPPAGKPVAAPISAYANGNAHAHAKTSQYSSRPPSSTSHTPSNEHDERALMADMNAYVSLTTPAPAAPTAYPASPAAAPLTQDPDRDRRARERQHIDINAALARRASQQFESSHHHYQSNNNNMPVPSKTSASGRASTSTPPTAGAGHKLHKGRSSSIDVASTSAPVPPPPTNGPAIDPRSARRASMNPSAYPNHATPTTHNPATPQRQPHPPLPQSPPREPSSSSKDMSFYPAAVQRAGYMYPTTPNSNQPPLPPPSSATRTDPTGYPNTNSQPSSSKHRPKSASVSHPNGPGPSSSSPFSHPPNSAARHLYPTPPSTSSSPSPSNMNRPPSSSRPSSPTKHSSSRLPPSSSATPSPPSPAKPELKKRRNSILSFVSGGGGGSKSDKTEAPPPVPSLPPGAQPPLPSFPPSPPSTHAQPPPQQSHRPTSYLYPDHRQPHGHHGHHAHPPSSFGHQEPNGNVNMSSVSSRGTFVSALSRNDSTSGGVAPSSAAGSRTSVSMSASLRSSADPHMSSATTSMDDASGRKLAKKQLPPPPPPMPIFPAPVSEPMPPLPPAPAPVPTPKTPGQSKSRLSIFASADMPPPSPNRMSRAMAEPAPRPPSAHVAPAPAPIPGMYQAPPSPAKRRLSLFANADSARVSSPRGPTNDRQLPPPPPQDPSPPLPPPPEDPSRSGSGDPTKKRRHRTEEERARDRAAREARHRERDERHRRSKSKGAATGAEGEGGENGTPPGTGTTTPTLGPDGELSPKKHRSHRSKDKDRERRHRSKSKGGAGAEGEGEGSRSPSRSPHKGSTSPSAPAFDQHLRTESPSLGDALAASSPMARESSAGGSSSRTREYPRGVSPLTPLANGDGTLTPDGGASPTKDKHHRRRKDKDRHGDNLAVGDGHEKSRHSHSRHSSRRGHSHSHSHSHAPGHAHSNSYSSTSSRSTREREPQPYPLVTHLTTAALVAPLLPLLSFAEFYMLWNLSKEVRELMEGDDNIREAVLERYLGSVGYRRWAFDERREVCEFSLVDLNEYLRGVNVPTHHYPSIASTDLYYLSNAPNADPARALQSRIVARQMVASTRAYSRLVIRLRAQAELEQLQWDILEEKERERRVKEGLPPVPLPPKDPEPHTVPIPRPGWNPPGADGTNPPVSGKHLYNGRHGRQGNLSSTSLSDNGHGNNGHSVYGGPPIANGHGHPPVSRGRFRSSTVNGSAPPSTPGRRSASVGRPSGSAAPSIVSSSDYGYSPQHPYPPHLRSAPAVPPIPFGGGSVLNGQYRFRSPLFKLGQAPLLRVFVPNSAGVWLSDDNILRCEDELRRAGVTSYLKVGDVVWDVALGDEGNVGRMVWDGAYLIDLDYTYTITGEIPPYIDSLCFPPSYWHKILRIPGDPIVHIDLQPYAEEIARNLALLQSRVQTETPQGAYHTVVRWIHRSSFQLRGETPLLPLRSHASAGNNAAGRTPHIDKAWEGTVFIEAEGTNEGLQELQERCGPDIQITPPTAPGPNKPMRKTPPKGKTVFRMIRAQSRPGELWLRCAKEKEKVLPA